MLRVFDNVVLRKIFGTKRDKVIGELRRLHNEELYDLYSSPNIACKWMIKSGIRWVGYVACMGNRRCAYRVWWGKRPLGGPRSTHGRIILKWIFKN